MLEAKQPGIWNPLPDFTDVKEDDQLGNIQPLPDLYEAVHERTVLWPLERILGRPEPEDLRTPALAGVRWPGLRDDDDQRDHAQPLLGQHGDLPLVGRLGGLLRPRPAPDVDENGYGLRVPGIVISPYARAGYIDHHQLSHDAYLKFVEDDFLEGSRLNPATDGRPDRRPDVREEAPGLGSLTNDFNFEQAPRAPVLLSAEPEPGEASKPPGSQQPPAVETGVAAGHSTSVTLPGTVNPDGASVSSCRFEYGTTTGYGSNAACASLPGSGSSPAPVSAALSGLAANTTYHYRLLATNSAGTSDGPDLSFTTAAVLPAVETGAASSVTAGSAQLNATVNPNGSSVSECKFEYGATASYGSSAPCTPSPGSGSGPVAVSAVLSGLAASSTYHYRITATNTGGAASGNDVTFKTMPSPPTVVTAAASGISQTAAMLNGEVDPNGAEVSECRFEYGTTVSYGSSAPCNPSPGSGSSAVAVSASLSGLSASSTYHFRITATNAGGVSVGKDTKFKTPPEPADRHNGDGVRRVTDARDVERRSRPERRGSR